MLKNITHSSIFEIESALVGFKDNIIHEQWTYSLDKRVKWFILNLALYRTDALDGRKIVVTDVLGLDNPRVYHKDGLAVDTRTHDMDREVRLKLRIKAFDTRDALRILSRPEGWRFGFDPHDDYENHVPAWGGEHFHTFVKEV